jgi:hypothetical protein
VGWGRQVSGLVCLTFGINVIICWVEIKRISLQDVDTF